MPGQLPREASLVFASCLLFFGGCALSPLAKHTAAFATATNQVVNSSEDAYRAAIDLHNDEQASAGVLLLQQGQAWDPRDTKPLLTQKALDARLTVLDGLKTYAQTLSDLTNNLNSPALDAAASSVGSSLSDLGGQLKLPDMGGLGFTMDAQTQNIASTAAMALGQFLTARKVKREVPKVTGSMDANVQALCTLLTADIAIIHEQTHRDYDDLIRQQTVYLRTTGRALPVGDFRAEALKLPMLVTQQEASDQLLQDLKTAIERLALTHHALAAAAQGNNPQALSARISDLEAAAQNLATYYKSLPTK